MKITPLLSPTRRLPKPPVSPSPTCMEDKKNAPATHQRSLKPPVTLLPSWMHPSSNRPSSISSSPAQGKKSHSASPRSRRDDKSSRLSYQDYTSYSTHQRDVLSRASPSQERNSYTEGSQCEVGDCHRNQLPGTTYCISHICRTDSCGDVRALGSRYCLNHKCRSCNTRAEAESCYCEVHKCRIASCVRIKEEGQDRCKQHICRWKECAEDPARGAWYYRDHTCAAGDCGLKILTIGSRLGNYCCCHTCSAEGCLLRVSATGAFCTEHECPTRGCPNPRRWDDESGPARKHECCKFHTCVQKGCFAPTTQIGTLCDHHFEGTF